MEARGWQSIGWGRGYLNDDDFMEVFLLFDYEDDDKYDDYDDGDDNDDDDDDDYGDDDNNDDDGNATWSTRTSWPGRGNEEVWIGLCGTCGALHWSTYI